MGARKNPYGIVDLHALASGLGADLDSALRSLRALYVDIDVRIARTTRDLTLPCAAGCDACCHESVFLTPLEFLLLWDHAQHILKPERLDRVVCQGLAVYDQHCELIHTLTRPQDLPSPERQRALLELRFACPLLDDAGVCRVYPARGLYGRLFGCSFNDAQGIYGCHKVGAALGDKTVTLIRAHAAARQLERLPLTFMRQVLPYYIDLLYR